LIFTTRRKRNGIIRRKKGFHWQQGSKKRAIRLLREKTSERQRNFMRRPLIILNIMMMKKQ